MACDDPDGADPSGDPPGLPPALEGARTDPPTLDGAGTSVEVQPVEGGLRRFTLHSPADDLDPEVTSPRVALEREGAPRLESGCPRVDALYALTLDDLRLLAAPGEEPPAGLAPTDGEYGWFHTGARWPGVWTRDVSYAIDLGVGVLEPLRSRSALLRKLSRPRRGGPLTIVQDTGTGGAYPVSTDRVVWALGARRALTVLTGEARRELTDWALEAITTTAEHDREVAFVPEVGLYRGEQSFLDWREQSYPEWVSAHVGTIAASFALSTNVGHLVLLELARDLSGRAGDLPASRRYASWASQLRKAIRRRLWVEEDGLLSTFVTTQLEGRAARQYDALGLALAVLEGVVDEATGRAMLGRYPTLPSGPPVLFPAQPHPPIYHNRAVWPFVTAYWARAARAARHPGVLDLSVRALLRQAARHLSNMECYEMFSERTFVADGELSGPVISSARQLWSVGGLLSAVHEAIFGLRVEAEGLVVDPWLPEDLREASVGRSTRVTLAGFPVAGRRVNVVLHLPEPPPASEAPAGPEGPGGAMPVLVPVEWSVDGVRIRGPAIPASVLSGEDSTIEVRLARAAADRAPVRGLRRDGRGGPLSDGGAPRAPRGDRRPGGVSEAGGDIDPACPWTWRAPPAPHIERAERTSRGVRLDLRVQGFGLRLDLLRDGRRIASDLDPPRTFLDEDAPRDRASDYTAECWHPVTGLCSHRALTVRVPPPWAVELGVEAFERTGGRLAHDHGRPHLADWGRPGDALEVRLPAVEQDGRHRIELEFANGSCPANSGITCAVKRVDVLDEQRRVVGGGYVPMASSGTWDVWRWSPPVEVQLRAGRAYQIRVHHDARSGNMSDLEHYARDAALTGGASGPHPYVDVARLRVMPVVDPWDGSGRPTDA